MQAHNGHDESKTMTSCDIKKAVAKKTELEMVEKQTGLGNEGWRPVRASESLPLKEVHLASGLQYMISLLGLGSSMVLSREKDFTNFDGFKKESVQNLWRTWI